MLLCLVRCPQLEASSVGTFSGTRRGRRFDVDVSIKSPSPYRWNATTVPQFRAPEQFRAWAAPFKCDLLQDMGGAAA